MLPEPGTSGTLPASATDPAAALTGAPARLGLAELVVLAAALIACEAIAIDVLLPAVSTIARSFGVVSPNGSQWVIFVYLAGLGCGELLWGLLSDRFGRRRTLLVGLGLMAAATLLCASSGSYAALLLWRAVQGIMGAVGVIAYAVLRDLYSGERMARVLSLVFLVFLASPVVGPSIGQALLLVGSWRDLFLVFGAWAALLWLWVLMRLPETLQSRHVQRLELSGLLRATGRVLSHRAALCYTLAATCLFGALMSFVGTVPQIVSRSFGHARLLPVVFGLCAAGMGAGSLLNVYIVERLGMRAVSHAAVLLLVADALLYALLTAMGLASLQVYIAMQWLSLACFGLTAANFGALAMQPMAAIAGLAASVQGFVTLLGGAAIGALIGQQLRDTQLPFALGSALCALCGLGFILLAERGRLFSGARASAHSGEAE